VITPQVPTAASHAERSQEGGYVAVMTALLMFVFMGLAAFAVDVGNWYVVGQKEQRAADAAALAGVTSLPSNPAGADATALSFSKINGFENVAATKVTSGVDGRPTRFRVTVSRTVDNIFGPLLGVPKTTVTRTAVADYAGPVPLGSPCNAFGNDPDPSASTNRASSCTSASQFWANIGSKGQTKSSGDAYQDDNCNSSPVPDGCSGSIVGPNTDLDPNGYIYTVTVLKPVTDLKIQVFDPAQIVVRDHCQNSPTDTNSTELSTAAALGAKAVVSDPLTRYAKGDGPWCTGDRNGGTTNVLNQTEFTIHGVGANAWDPVHWPLQTNCGTAPGTAVAGATNPKTFDPFEGDLSRALDKTRLPAGPGNFMPNVAANFRQWVDLCTISGAVQPGTYAIQVQTSIPGGQGGHNRFGLRAFGSNSTDKDSISVAGFDKMGIFANFNGTTQFFLARVPSAAAGQILNVGLFDVGDAPASGTITLLKPAESTVTLSNCVATGSTAALTKPLPDCSFAVNSTDNQGRWQNIAVPIPSAYTCRDDLATGCWIILKYYYGSSNPADATSWTASIQGDPVRLVE
jgi:Flp pilus assembly protein TadG